METQWADIVCLVFQNLYYRLLGIVLQVWFHVTTLLLPHMSVWRVLHEQQLHPYHLQKVHALGALYAANNMVAIQPTKVCNSNSET